MHSEPPLSAPQSPPVAPGSPFSTPESPPPAVEFRGVCKAFGPVRANDDISLALAKGKIHGIVGENGAGKTTLMNVLYGCQRADAGEIYINGARRSLRSSAAAIRAGIGMVHQHFMLVDNFSVLENIMLGCERGMFLGANSPGPRRARAELQRLAAEYKLRADPDALTGDLPVGAQQRVEMLKTLVRGAEILILDEPTGALTPQEADDLFRILRVIRGQGKTVVLITHKLREIMAVSDRVTVMRDGRVVAVRETRDTNAGELSELMVGRAVATESRTAPPRRDSGTALTVKNLRVRDRHRVVRVRDVNLSLRSGEILGVAGVAGNGQSELLEALAGMCRVDGGEIVFHRGGGGGGGDGQGEAAAGSSPSQLRAKGVAHVPEDRRATGMVAFESASHAAILGYHREAQYRRGRNPRGIFFDWPFIGAQTRRRMDEFDVRPPLPEIRAAQFSGGNQQKLILAREMVREPRVLLIGQPTRGVDIGAIEFIHRKILTLRDQGSAILLVSVELEEILALADRIVVMFNGAVVGETPAAAADEKQLGRWMAGVRDEG